ncbi:MAG TPA: hypothetical protein VLW85_07310 [Myxococcales bacterium]|nr:hypothetical protein [Myxococcales bacterium]
MGVARKPVPQAMRAAKHPRAGPSTGAANLQLTSELVRESKRRVRHAQDVRRRTARLIEQAQRLLRLARGSQKP